MGRRRYERTSAFEDVIMLTSRLPWWACLLLAVVSYGILHAFAERPPQAASAMKPGQMGDAVVSGLFTTMAVFGQLLVPAGFVFAAIISGITAFRERKIDMGALPNRLDSAPVPRKRLSKAVDDYVEPLQPTVDRHDLDYILPDLPEVAPVVMEEDPLPIVWDEEVLRMIEWKRFEIITREFLTLSGHEAQVTNVGADGGVDIRVTKRGNEAFRGIVQCKAWNAYKVGVKPVRELYGVMAAEGIKNGMLITSGTFTVEAEEFAQGRVMLISGSKLLKLIKQLPEEKRQTLLDLALEGDFRTPTCPQCDVKMTLRESTKGKHVGGQFWGCPRYPRCKQTLVYKPK